MVRVLFIILLGAVYSCNNSYEEKPFIDKKEVIKTFKDSNFIDVSRYLNVLETNYSDSFISEIILPEIRVKCNEQFLLDLFDNKEFRLDYSDTNYQRQFRIVSTVLNSVFNENYLKSDPKNEVYLDKLAEIERVYYPDIVAGKMFSFVVSIALIDDLYKSGIISNEELNLLLVVRYILLDATRN